MSERVVLHSFGDFDRSGKVRWLAHELGWSVDEARLRYPQHHEAPYTTLNPLHQVPTAQWQGRVLIESTAICQVLAESTVEPKLWIGPCEEGREEYLTWIAAAGETLESRMVDCAVSKAGILGPEYFELQKPMVIHKLRTLAARLPSAGWVAGGRFTLADIIVGYSMRLGVETGLLERSEVEPWISRCIARPAAEKSRFFKVLSEA